MEITWKYDKTICQVQMQCHVSTWKLNGNFQETKLKLWNRYGNDMERRQILHGNYMEMMWKHDRNKVETTLILCRNMTEAIWKYNRNYLEMTWK